MASYRGSKTTLCAGCGHNAISERIIDAFYEMGVDPKRVMKFSGIGCSIVKGEPEHQAVAPANSTPRPETLSVGAQSPSVCREE